MTTTNTTTAVESGNESDERAAAQPFRDDIDIMGLNHVDRIAGGIVSAVLVTGHIRTLNQAAPGLMKSAGEFGEDLHDTKAIQIAHALELMAILQTPEVLEKATRRIAARLWRDLEVDARLGRDDRMLARLLPAIVEMCGGPEQFAVDVMSRLKHPTEEGDTPPA